MQRLDYTYDANSNITEILDYRNSSQIQCFEYDDLNRLKEAYTDDNCTGTGDSTGNGTYDHSYTYDDLGNIKPTGGNYAYGNGTNAGRHAPTAANGWTYAYDANGNQDTRTHPSPSTRVDTLTFDYNNRLTNYETDTNGSPTDTSFVYDADGTRVAVIDNDGHATHYVGGIYKKDTNTDNYKHTYVFGGQTIGINDNGTRHHVVTDHLGSITVTVEYGTSTKNKVRYHPYGEQRHTTGTAATAETYTGQLADPTGLMFYNARYYDPTLRTFISADTIVPNPASGLSWNRYSYVLGNPVNANDPSGHCSWDPTCGNDGNSVGNTGGSYEQSEQITVDEAEQRIQITDNHARGYGNGMANPFRGDTASVYTDGSSFNCYATGGCGQLTEIPVERFEPFGGPEPGYEGAYESGYASGQAVSEFALEGLATYGIVRFGRLAGGSAVPDGIFGPGPNAHGSVAASSTGASTAERRGVDAIGDAFGCHRCSTRASGKPDGSWVPDHQPVTSLNYANAPQRLYPHCMTCSRVQGALVSNVRQGVLTLQQAMASARDSIPL